MRKFLIYCLLASIMLGMLGCSVEDSNAATESTAAESSAVETILETVPPTTEPPVYEGTLYLTISSLTFSIVGESEDIYCGNIPVEEVTWESADESVAVVENGVVTATGVGETTVSASYLGQRVECTIGCIANTEEELKTFTLPVLYTPRKMPPVLDDEPCTYYDDTVIIGDSVSYSLMQWAIMTGELGNATFLVRGGNGINGYVMGYKTISFQGKEMTLEDAVALSGAKKAFIMMGVNDLAYMTADETIAKYATLLDMILEKSPDLEIYIESCLPVWDAGIQGAKNVEVEEFNEKLQELAETYDCHYVEFASYIKDHTGGMAQRYCSDFTTHMNFDGTDIWMQAMKLYALTQTLEEN